MQIERMTRTLLASLLAVTSFTALTSLAGDASARVLSRTPAASSVNPSTEASAEAPAEAPIEAPLNVQRVQGDKLVTPDALTVAAILRSERRSVIGVFNVCIDSKGDVADINVVRSTRFPAYDAKIQRQVRTWRYQPVLLGGLPAPVCTKVTFVYQQKQ